MTTSPKTLGPRATTSLGAFCTDLDDGLSLYQLFRNDPYDRASEFAPAAKRLMERSVLP